MELKLGFVALLAGTPVIHAHAVQAQTSSTVAPSEEGISSRKPADSAKTALQTPRFLDADGNPLPDDVQRELAEMLKSGGEIIQIPTDGQPATPASNEPDIMVTGQRLRGSVTSDMPAERTFGPLEISAYGASNIRELIQALGPQVASNLGRENAGPVTLLNGRRVSSFTEIAQIPTEAIERMEVFPEELAVQYGYRADQKILNIVTFERFRSFFGQLGQVLSTEGGYDSSSVATNYFAIRGNTRLDFGAEYSRSASLSESERNLAQLESVSSSGGFRTLLPKTDRLTLNGLVSDNLFGGVAATLNGRFETSEMRSLLGLDGDAVLRRNIATRSMHTGTTLHGRVGKWLWTFAGNYDRLRTNMHTEFAGDGTAQDRARSIDSFASADLLLSGTIFKLPAGPVTSSVRIKTEMRDFDAAVSRHALAYRTDIARDVGAAQMSVDIPVSRRVEGEAGSPVGNLSVNANLEIERLSDMGTLRTYGYGLNWSPIAAINIIASATHEQGAPTMEQLGAPLITTPGVRTYDFNRREVVDITRLSGGNSALRHDDRRSLRIGLNAKPLAVTDLTVSVSYVSTRVTNPIADFPLLNSQIEAAFPDRVTRDADGRLLQIDASPLNFARSRQQLLRWGINFVRPLGATDALTRNSSSMVFASEAEMRAALPTGTVVVMAEPGSALTRRMDNMDSRLYFSAYQTWNLQNDLLIDQSLPALDLLNGGALDLYNGPRRHGLEFQAGVFKKGQGARITLNWQSGMRLRDTGGGNLTVSRLATMDLYLFANLADTFGGLNSRGWLKGLRATIGIINLLNTRPKVQDGMGLIPLNYQSPYLDPIGRVVSFNLRKVF